MTSHKYFVIAVRRKKRRAAKKKKKSNRNVAANRWDLRRSTWRMRNADTAQGQESFAIMSAAVIYDISIRLSLGPLSLETRQQ